MATIMIKIKGVQAGQPVTAGKLNMLAGKAVKGGATAATKLGKGGALLFGQGVQREVEIEGGRLALQGKVGAHAAIQQPFPALTKAKAFGGAALQTGGVAKAGTIWTGTGTGLGLGLGLVGPILLVTALGLVATGIYIYIRSQNVQRGADEPAN